MATPSKNEAFLTEMDKLEIKHMKDELILKRMREAEKKHPNGNDDVDEIIAKKLELDAKSLELFYRYWFNLGGKKAMFEAARDDARKN